MKDVLFAIDADESRAMVQATTVTGLFDGENVTAHLLHVFADNPEGASVTQLGSVRRIAAALEDEGFAVEHHEESGDPVERIVETADEIDADAICIAGRKRSSTGKLVFGSVTQDVILTTERAVLVCGTAESVTE